ncbi:MAG: S8 family peptidase [Desulfobacterales bacterium]|nr:S8 family peptidase [Desulfobacterales bacterium]
MKNLLTGAVILIAANIIAVSAGYTETTIKTGTEGEQTFLESTLSSAERSLIGNRLSAILNRKHSEAGYREDNEVLDVLVGLREENEVYNDPPEYGSATFDESGRAVVKINGKVVDEKEMEANTKKRYERIAARREARVKKRRYKLQKLADRNGLHRASGFQKAVNGGHSSLKVKMPKGQLIEFVQKNKDDIAGIELYNEPKLGLADAIIATNIDPWALDWSPDCTGTGIGIYMSDGFNCPEPGYISNYTRIEGPSRDNHSELISDVLRGVSPDSYIYCRPYCELPDPSELNGYDGNPPIHIENYTCGRGDDNSYSIYDRDFDNHVYDNNVNVFVLAGNYYKGNIWTRGRGLNVITVGNYDNRNNKINEASCYVNPITGNEKPEIVAPGTDITARGYTSSGTSFAAPHAAGFAANILSKYKSWVTGRPSLIKAHMMAAATDVISGDPDKVGVGGINFLSNPWNPGAMMWWEGGNNDFSKFDSTDPYPNDGYIDYKVYINVGGGEQWDNIRIVLCWLNRGTYTYEHTYLFFPMGMDLDMKVYDPNGNVVGESNSSHNPYEVVNFTPTTEGYYRIQINRYANLDTSSKLHIGLVVNPY